MKKPVNQRNTISVPWLFSLALQPKALCFNGHAGKSNACRNGPFPDIRSLIDVCK